MIFVPFQLLHHEFDAICFIRLLLTWIAKIIRRNVLILCLFCDCEYTAFYWEPEVSDETGALLVYSCFITYKSFSHRPTSIEHAEL